MEYCTYVRLLLVYCHLNCPEVSTSSSELEKSDSWSEFYVPEPLVATTESPQDHHTFSRQNLGIEFMFAKISCHTGNIEMEVLAQQVKSETEQEVMSMVLTVKELCWKNEHSKMLISMHI